MSEAAVIDLFVALPQAQQIILNRVNTYVIEIRALQGCNMCNLVGE